MSIDLLAFAALGGVIPDAIRTLKWARSPKAKRGANPLGDSATYIALVIQVLLGLLAASLLVVTTPLQAVAVGYAAPDILVRVFGAAAKATTARMGAASTPRNGVFSRMVERWNS
jgi:hypothetical protein